GGVDVPPNKSFETIKKSNIKNPFDEEDVSYFDNEEIANLQDFNRKKWIEQLTKNNETMQLARKGSEEGNFVIYHPSTKGNKYQLSY
ncbi:hypothetical protein ACI3PL_24800, partial [Lacticaseibacillus paracasei]